MKDLGGFLGAAMAYVTVWIALRSGNPWWQGAPTLLAMCAAGVIFRLLRDRWKRAG